MHSKKEKNIKLVQKISVVFLAGFLFLFSPQKTEAAWIVGLDPAIKEVLDIAHETIMGIIRGAAKTAATKMLNGQVNSLMAGNGTNGAAFITNWQDYLVTQPQNSTITYMNSYIAGMTGGRGNSTGYSSEGFGGTGNYASSLTQIAKNSLSQQNSTPKMTYEGDPSQMFASGNFKNMELYLSGVNNPRAFNMAVDSAYQKKLDEQKLIAQVLAMAYQGFKGTTNSNGTVTYPGSLAKELVAGIQNIPNNAIASATSIPEVITSVVSSMINTLFRNGFSSIQQSAQNQASTQNKLDSATNASASTNGPSTWTNPDTKSPYNPSTASSTSTWVNPDNK